MTVLSLLLALPLFVVGPSSDADALAQAKQVETLIDRGELAQAEAQLRSESFSPLVEATLQGRLAMARSKPAQAVRSFRKAVTLAPDHGPLRILLAHAQLAAKQHADALRTLEHESVASDDPAVAQLRARAYLGRDEPKRAYNTLVAASSAHPDDVALRRQLVLVCAQADLFVTAQQWAQTLRPAQLGSPTVVAVLQRARTQPGALPVARSLAAGFPDDAQVQAELGWVESAAGEFNGAARALARAARLGADTAYAAAEHYRAARRYRDALSANAMVRERARRLGQRFDILFESGRMARAIAAAQSLETSSTLSPRQRYNLAYAHYSLRQFAEATRRARGLTDTSEAGRARALLRAMGR